jgi:hypothetical protein
MSPSDKEAITHAINLYAFAVDTQGWELFDQVFTADIRADYSPTALWTGLDTLKRDFAVYHDPFDGTQHVMTIHLSNSTATRRRR